MSILLTRFQELFPDFKEIREQHILNEQKIEVGWNSVILTQNNETISAGTHSNRETARRIAIAEGLERKIVRILLDKNDCNFLMNEIPSSSACAVGFEDLPTRSRALFEGYERWAWSQWIDSGYKIERLEPSHIELNKLAKSYAIKFEEIFYYNNIFEIESNWLGINKLQFGVVLGINKNGIYPGSRVSTLGDDLWTHGIVEAWRNYVISNLNSSGHKDSIILRRIKYFSENKNVALNQISKAKRTDWKIPKVRLLKPFKLNESDPFFFWRSLCYDFSPWNIGDESRFVY